MNTEQERWGEALAVDRMYGEKATQHVAERIGVLAGLGDAPGVERWLAIAQRLDQLSGGVRQ